MFGSMQMAVSRVIKLQHHRIAQVLAMVLEAGGTWEMFGEAGLAQEHGAAFLGHSPFSPTYWTVKTYSFKTGANLLPALIFPVGTTCVALS